MVRGLMTWAAVLGCAAGTASAGMTVTESTATAAEAIQQRDAKVGYLEISETPVERPGPFDWLSSDGGAPTLLDIVDSLMAAATRSDLDAVVIRLKGVALSYSQVEEIGQAIEFIRDSGKKVHVFSESFGASDLLLASYADEVLGQTGGPVSLPGLYAESMFYREMFDWVGIRPDFVQIGDYKGANEAYMNAKPSEAWEQNISQLLDSMYGNMRETMMQGRGLSSGKLDEAMEHAWYTDANHAAELGLIDEAIDLDDLGAHVAEAYGDDVSWDRGLLKTSSGLDFDPGNPFAALSLFLAEPNTSTTGPTIAVVHIDGPIVDGDSAQGGLFGSATVGSRTIRRIINDVKNDDNVRGVIIRVNSPGGSATASEVIWQGFRRLAEEKPVWVSVGNLAASGGYYIAVAGDKIYANESAIVGSIGVVGGKLAMGGVYDHLRLNVVTRARGPRAGMFGSVEPWTAGERDSVRRTMQDTYEQFTDRVKSGRSRIDLSKTAEGRLFTGDKALPLQMIDEVGTLHDTISDLAEEVELSTFDVRHYPGPQDLESLFEEAFGMASAPSRGLATGSVADGLLRVLAQTASPELARRVKQTIDATIMLKDEPVMLLDMSPVVFR